MLAFIFTTFGTNYTLGSFSTVYKNIQAVSAVVPREGNKGGKCVFTLEQRGTLKPAACCHLLLLWSLIMPLHHAAGHVHQLCINSSELTWSLACSYLTMFSKEGLIFGRSPRASQQTTSAAELCIAQKRQSAHPMLPCCAGIINIIGNFGTVFNVSSHSTHSTPVFQEQIKTTSLTRCCGCAGPGVLAVCHCSQALRQLQGLPGQCLSCSWACCWLAAGGC